MAKVSELKEQARALEQQGELEKALRIYTHILQHLEASKGILTELPLYVKAGDLHLKLGRAEQAVAMYERAAVFYADHGSGKSVIALCQKVLRATPDAADVHLRFCRRLLRAGHVEAANAVLTDFGERYEMDPLLGVLRELEDRPEGEARPLLQTLLSAAERGESAELERVTADVTARLTAPSAAPPAPPASPAAVPESPSGAWSPQEPAWPPETRTQEPPATPPDAMPSLPVATPVPEAPHEAPPVAPPPAPPEVEAPSRVESSPPPIERELLPMPPAPTPRAEAPAAPSAPRLSVPPPSPPRVSGHRPSVPPRRSGGVRTPVMAPPVRRRSRAVPIAAGAIVVLAAAAAALKFGGVLGGGGGAANAPSGVAPMVPPAEPLGAGLGVGDTTRDTLGVAAAGSTAAASQRVSPTAPGTAAAAGVQPQGSDTAARDTGRVGGRQVTRPSAAAETSAARPAPTTPAGAAADTTPTTPVPIQPPPTIAVEAEQPTALPFSPIVVGGLDVEGVRAVTVDGTRGVEATQLLSNGQRVVVTTLPLRSDAADVPAAGLPPRVTTTGDTAVAVTRYGTYEVRLRGTILGDSLAALVSRLVERP